MAVRSRREGRGRRDRGGVVMVTLLLLLIVVVVFFIVGYLLMRALI